MDAGERLSTRRPMLYIAGPFTFPDSMHNTHKALKFATAVFEHTSYVPYVPHLTLLWNIVTPRDYVHWTSLDKHALMHCDAIVRLPGLSPGADAELTLAAELELPVIDFETMPAVVCRQWRPESAAR